MYNANMSSNEELPSTAKLIKSTILALVGAGIILVTVVMPAEYGIDPTGVGKVLGLKAMGEIKHSLAHEAETDARAHAVKQDSRGHASDSHSNDHGDDGHHYGEQEEQTESAKEIFQSRQSKGHHHGDGDYHQH